MRELRPGVWHWQAPHPDWRESEPWDPNVSSYAIDDGERLLLFDPLAPPQEIEALTAGRETIVVLTAPWHERDTKSLVERLGTPVYARWLREAVTWEQVAEGLRPLLALPVELVLPAHGAPTDRAALERVLS